MQGVVLLLATVGSRIGAIDGVLVCVRACCCKGSAYVADDNIVVLRAASRAPPPRAQGSLSLSFSKGFVFDANAANKLLERLRKVRLRWRQCKCLASA